MENIHPRQLPLQILPEEIEIINDIRSLNFGKVTVSVQNGVIVSKEVTTVTKNGKNKYGANGNGNSNSNNFEYNSFSRIKTEII